MPVSNFAAAITSSEPEDITDSSSEDQSREYYPAVKKHPPLKGKRIEGVHFISGSLSIKNSPPIGEE